MEKHAHSTRPMRTYVYSHLLIFIAFGVISLVAALFIWNFLKSALVERVDYAMQRAEANIRIGIQGAEIVLINSYHNLNIMQAQESSTQEIHDYLTATTRQVLSRNDGFFNLLGMFAYINGEFLDGGGGVLPPDFNPQMQHWYQLAMEKGGGITYSDGRHLSLAGQTVFSIVRAIEIEGEIVGILGIDIDVGSFLEQDRALSPIVIAGGHSMILSPSLIVLAYRNSDYVGRPMSDLGDTYQGVASALAAGDQISAVRLRDVDGSLSIAFFYSFINDWFWGVKIPFFDFYSSFIIVTIIMFALGLCLSIGLSYILRQLSNAKLLADEENEFKSAFLANISNDMRAPMNTITGITEVMLRERLAVETRNYVYDIQQAGSTLLAIISNVMDFSKIQAGKMDIANYKYALSFLVEDTISLIHTQLGEKPVRFYSNIDAAIPNTLIGDEARVRQILLNLLSNAVKFTEKGHIALLISIKKQEQDHIWLNFTVSDTGRGIKKEEQDILLEDFFKLVKRISGAGKIAPAPWPGLGLYITKQLCDAMGGFLSLKSEYGYGSSFTATIPQGFVPGPVFAKVENPQEKKVLVYENRLVYTKSLSWSLNNLDVYHASVSNEEDFIQALRREEWDFVFTGYGMYKSAKFALEAELANAKKIPRFALVAEWRAQPYIPETYLLYLSTQALSIANILNGRAAYEIKSPIQQAAASIQVIFKDARVLIVDDIATNIQVAGGLIAPYKIVVDSCLSGIEAIKMVQERHYDIVFMDHMMPEMDGEATVAAIREWEAQREKNNPDSLHQRLTIVALTANAAAGMREMFLQRGFDDFLSKPMNTQRLEEVLVRWIPSEKMHTESPAAEFWEADDKKTEAGGGKPSAALPDVPGLDAQTGLKMVGGNAIFYKKALVIFAKDVSERVQAFKAAVGPEALHNLALQIHALKSACGYIGAADAASRAAELELAAKSENLELVQKKLPGFAEQLENLAQGILAWTAGGASGGGAVSDAAAGGGAPSGGASAGTEKRVAAPKYLPRGLPENAALQESKEVLTLFQELDLVLRYKALDHINRVLADLSKIPQGNTGEGSAAQIAKKISNHIQQADFAKAIELTKGEIARRTAALEKN
ncbi:MAG: ATP-binding protein [Spirochaetes bacterium]|nr:ATP-binding protein [Spirochaetota bacterium]